MESATISPTSSMATSASRSAAIKGSSAPKRLARSRAVLRPTLGMPSAKIKESSLRVLLAAMADTRFSAFFCAKRSSETRFSTVSAYSSCGKARRLSR